MTFQIGFIFVSFFLSLSFFLIHFCFYCELSSIFCFLPVKMIFPGRNKIVKINTTITITITATIYRRTPSCHAAQCRLQKAVGFTADDGGFAIGNDFSASSCNSNKFHSNNRNRHHSRNEHHSTRNLDSFSTISEKLIQLNAMAAVGISLDCKMKLF